MASAWAKVIRGWCSRRSRSRSAPAAWRGLARRRSAAKSTMTRCSGREHPNGLTFAPSTKGRTRCFPNRYCGSRTSMSPNFVCQRSFFHLGDASEVVDECPVPLPRPGSAKRAAPPVPAHASPPPAFFRSVRFLQLPLVAFDRQHDRSHPLPQIRTRSQSRNQRLVAARLEPRDPLPPPAKSMRTESPLHRFRIATPAVPPYQYAQSAALSRGPGLDDS